MKINNEFNFGDIVYLRTDMNQSPRMVVAFEVYAEGEMLYKVSSGTLTSYHYAMELSKDRDMTIVTNNY